VRLLRFDERQRAVSEQLLGVGALVALSSAVASIFGTMCDPHIKVAGAPPFGSHAIYGIPVRLLVMFALIFAAAGVKGELPRAWSVLVRFRIAVFIVCFVAAIVLPMLPYPHQILGACNS